MLQPRLTASLSPIVTPCFIALYHSLFVIYDRKAKPQAPRSVVYNVALASKQLSFHFPPLSDTNFLFVMFFP